MYYYSVFLLKKVIPNKATLNPVVSLLNKTRTLIVKICEAAN